VSLGSGGKKKTWPKSWQQAAMNGTLTLKGRSFEREYILLPVRVEAARPNELEERVDAAVVEETLKRGAS
jgi:hypothetical protein